MKQINSTFIMAILIFSHLYGVTENYSSGGRPAGMANAAVTLYDIWAIGHNQAGLTSINRPTAGVYVENRFMTRELSFGSCALIFPTLSGVIGISLNYFGFELYNQNKIGLALARKFGDRLSTGVQLNYINTNIADNYGSSGSITFEAGFIYDILPKMRIGAHVFNPTRAKSGGSPDYRIPTILRTGVTWIFSDKVFLIAESELTGQYKPVFRAGIEYHVADPFYFRCGIGTNPTINSFGFSLTLAQIRLDLATTYHQALGYSPQISFAYQF